MLVRSGFPAAVNRVEGRYRRRLFHLLDIRPMDLQPKSSHRVNSENRQTPNFLRRFETLPHTSPQRPSCRRRCPCSIFPNKAHIPPTGASQARIPFSEQPLLFQLHIGVLLWLKSQALSNQQMHYSYEHLFIDLLDNGKTDEQELRTVLGILNWKPEDRYLCLKLQEQNSGDLVHPDLAVNSRLSSLLSHHVSFQHQHKLCVILNLSVSGLDLGELRQRMAPLIRDSCLYVGISNPIDGIGALRLGFIQADIALEYITGTDSSDWMVLFASCALNYIRQSACKQLPASMVAHPLLLDLMEYDRAQGTQYYNTLRVYLLCERNIPATAAALIIHRTTLTYRLGKILELTHLNLDNASLRMYLLLSFQLLDQDGNRDFIRS